MLFRLFPVMLAVAVMSLGELFAPAADHTQELLLRVPASANVLAIVDVEGMFKSKLGLSQTWSRRYYIDYANGLVSFPPTVQTAVLAAELDSESMSTNWELGIVRLKQPFPMKKLAEREVTSLEKFEGLSLVTTQKQTYFIELQPQMVSVTNHQNRQNMARWLQVRSAAGIVVQLAP